MTYVFFDWITVSLNQIAASAVRYLGSQDYFYLIQILAGVGQFYGFSRGRRVTSELLKLGDMEYWVNPGACGKVNLKGNFIHLAGDFEGTKSTWI